MLRGANIVTGTSTTGVSTLTAAACPSLIGAVDLHAYLTSLGFVSGNALLLPLKIIEYTDNTFAKPKFVEEGWYTVTIGASITAMTIARTTPQITSDANANAYDDTTPTAITIGTAANVLIFMGPSANDTITVPPYFGALGDNIGFQVGGGVGSGSNFALTTDGTGVDWYWEFLLTRPLLLKRAAIRVTVAYSGGTPVSSAYFRLYAVSSIGKPGKLLLDLGALGGANPLNATGNISTALHSTGLWLSPGLYFGNIFATFTGGTTGPSIRSSATAPLTSILGVNAGVIIPVAIATGGSSTAADPANTTSYAVSGVATGMPYIVVTNV